ncbi:protein LURP-one-related 7 [Cinnamomum micranthum f. kanehirae]|uniref:Protein LURP-one-related 7 n=1 Tax=Cinnamomum micranthum f. kanehirae TaxID=337451 RepID=A0A443NKD5_9MAGN|nr:protein LURP-one-related 7 [Cinnamomum micranthum f. kanehirae]
MASTLERPCPCPGSAQIPIDLIISKGFVLTRGDLKVTDAHDNLLYRVDSRSTDQDASSKNKNRRILLDATKNPIISIIPCNSNGGAWQGYRGEGLEWKDLIFRVERTLHSRLRTELEVFFGGENSEGLVPDFRVKGSPFHRSCIIYRGDSIAAQTSAMYKLGKPIVGRRKFRLTIYPGIDHSFVVALLVIFFDGKN